MTDMTEAVESWARAEAEDRYETRMSFQTVDALRAAEFITGIAFLADRLLSDDTVRKAANGIYYAGVPGESAVDNETTLRDAEHYARAALVAALAAVTEGSK